jgi:hypothetical protein
MSTSSQPTWTLNTKQLAILSLYAALAPAFLFLISIKTIASQLLAATAFISTLPFWPLTSIPIQATEGVLAATLTAWVMTFLQAWYALVLLRKRARNKGTNASTELMGIVKRSAVLLLAVLIMVTVVMVWLTVHQ